MQEIYFQSSQDRQFTSIEMHGIESQQISLNTIGDAGDYDLIFFGALSRQTIRLNVSECAPLANSAST